MRKDKERKKEVVPELKPVARRGSRRSKSNSAPTGRLRSSCCPTSPLRFRQSRRPGVKVIKLFAPTTTLSDIVS